MPTETVREAVGLFRDEAALRDAADELMISGFDRSALSVLAGSGAIERTLGDGEAPSGRLADEPEVPRLGYVGSDSRTEAKGAVTGGMAYLGAVVAVGAVAASGGTIGAAFLAAATAGGAGGLVGAALARFIDRHHAHYLHAHLDHGGLLLWVHVEDDEQERRAMRILGASGASEVHVHELPRPMASMVHAGASYDLSFMKRLGM